MNQSQPRCSLWVSGHARWPRLLAAALVALTCIAAFAPAAAAATPYYRSTQFEWSYFKQITRDFDIPSGNRLVLEYVIIYLRSSKYTDTHKSIIYPAIQLDDGSGVLVYYQLPYIHFEAKLNDKDTRILSQCVTLRGVGTKLTVVLNQNKDLPWEEVDIVLSGHLESL